MLDEKDMVEINLNEHVPPAQDKEGKVAYYFGNIRFIRPPKSSGHVPYDPQRNEDNRIKSVVIKNDLKQNDCLRQMYCPACQQRLDMQDAQDVHEKLKPRLVGGLSMLLPLACVYASCFKPQQAARKVYCKKCNYNLGYWKNS